MTHLFESKSTTDQYWGARGKRGAEIGDKKWGETGGSAVGTGPEVFKMQSQFLHLKM